MNELPIALLGSLKTAPWGWLLLVTILVTLIKAWPIIHLQALNARARLRQEKRDDLAELRKRVDGLIEDHHKLELKLLGSISAYRILDAELEARDPDCSALGQARAVLSAAFTMSPSTEGGRS